MSKLIIIIFSTLLLYSCSGLVLNSMNRMADDTLINTQKNVAYHTHQITKLDIYIPKNKPTIATVVFFFGGCWGRCSNLTKDDYFFVAQTLSQYGIATVIPDFRQYPEVGFDTIMSDSAEVIHWLIANGYDYGIQTDDIFLMGHSSGAHIAALLANDDRYLQEDLKSITAFIGLAGPYGYSPNNSTYKPIDLIDGNEAPQLILHGMEDKRVGKINSIHYAEVLEMANIKHELILLDNISHAKLLLSFAKPFRNKSIALKKIIQFIASESKIQSHQYPKQHLLQ